MRQTGGIKQWNLRSMYEIVLFIYWDKKVLVANNR